MLKCYRAVKRKAAFIAAAGILLQTTGCDLSGQLQDITMAVASAVVSNFVFGLFNLV